MLELFYRDQIFPHAGHALAFERLREREGDRRACKTSVELLALAHDRACESQLAAAIGASLDAGGLPDLSNYGVSDAKHPRRKSY